MPKASSVHVVPAGSDWQVKQDGRTLSTHRTQGAALDAGRPVARAGHTELVTHRANGQIRASDSHGHDPSPPRG